VFSYQGTFLGRIVEFDSENIIGLMETGNYLITHEHISYILDKNGMIEVTYQYTIQKITHSGNNTFGLSLRNRTHDGGLVYDIPVNELSIIANGNHIGINHVESPHIIFDDNGIPIEFDWNNNEEHWRFITSGYLGWYYFTLDFQPDDELNITIKYQTSDPVCMRYNSHPFWIPVANTAELTVTIENNFNELFLTTITNCRPRGTLITENWRLEKPSQAQLIITYTSGWFSKNKGVFIDFSSIHEPRGSPSLHFLSVVWEGLYFPDNIERHGVFIHDFDRPISWYPNRNLSLYELEPYELVFLNRWQLRIIRNAFYARHKFRFNDPELIQFLYYNFSSREYFPDSFFNMNFTEETLSAIERKNIEIIQRLENFTD
jgi:hypothetical protein